MSTRMLNELPVAGRVSAMLPGLPVAGRVSAMLPGLARLSPMGGAAPAPPDPGLAGYVSIFNTAYTATEVKATSNYSGYNPYRGADPTLSLTGQGTAGSWLSAGSSVTNQKFNLDLGSERVIKRLYLENFHGAGTVTNRGIKNFIVYGTNSGTAFANTTYADTTDLTELATFQATQHPASDTVDPQYFDLSANTTAYRYYILRIADNWGATDEMGFRRLECQVVGDRGTSAFPAPIDTTTCYSTSSRSTSYQAMDGVNPVPALTGAATDASWQSSSTAGQKFNLDLKSAKVAKYVYIESFHDSGGSTNIGLKNFSVYGTNSGTAFTNTTYTNTTDLVLLGEFTATQHPASDAADPQYFNIQTNTTAYRYYVLHIHNNWGGSYIGARRISIMVE